jgi:hypothetical protein
VQLKNINMKQLLPLSLFLFLFPCLAWAQYPSNGNQKITLGEQSTADGLIFRGVAATDTVRKPSIDTMAYMVLDTTTNIIWHYKKATINAWLRLNLLPSDTASMLTNYWRSGRFSGVLPVANGGTNTSTAFTAGSVIFAGTSGTYTQNNSGLFWDNTNSRLGVGTNSLADILPTSTFAKFKIVDGNNSFVMKDFDTGQGYIAVGSTTNNIYGFVGHTNTADGFVMGSFSNHDLVLRSNSSNRIIIKNNGEIYMLGTTDRGAYNLQVNGTGVWGEGAYVNGSDANIKENIIDLDSSLNIVNNLKPVVFNYINASVNNDTKHLGFIAQDVYQTLENKDYLGSIVRSDGDTLSIAYSNIIPLLTKAIQEQQALIKALEQRIINLENK